MLVNFFSFKQADKANQSKAENRTKYRKVFKIIVMRLNFHLLLLSLTIAVIGRAQVNTPSSLNIGDSAPPLRVSGWIKGTPIQKFEKGTVYVVEFWATWCKPCIAAMTHLSALACEYKNTVTVLGIDVYEKKTTSMKKVKAFVDSMGHQIDCYHLATEDSNFTVADWLDASGDRQQGIPRCFVVNTEGRLAWIGRPKDLEEVLPKVVNHTWGIKEALAKRNLDKRLAELDDSARVELNGYVGNAFKAGDLGKPDSALLVIDEIIKKEPKLKYAPAIAFHTFSSLLKTNPHEAYEYGKAVLVTSTYEEPACYAIIGPLEWYSNKLNIPAEIYELGAEAFQVGIDQIPYPGLADLSKLYSKMAGWYWIAKDKSKAIEAEQKAIEALKNEKGFSKTVLAEFDSQLRQYKNM